MNVHTNTDTSQMKERAEEVGFRVGTVDWLHLALKDQATWMRETDVLAGMYGVGLIKMIFARPGSAILELIPYCFSNASDFWELSQALRLRHYVWRNPNPRLSACHVEHCRVHQCGYNPAPEDRRMAGGSADPLAPSSAECVCMREGKGERKTRGTMTRKTRERQRERQRVAE